MTRYLVERLNPNFGYFYRIDSSIMTQQTDYQQMEIVETPEFGKVMLLDNITQVAEKNEYLYHEPMVHPALVTHPNPQSVCVIGGGDGGIMREVLKHKPALAVQCDLDGQVMDACERHLPQINQGVFREKNVEQIAGDGRKYIETTDNVFDVVIMDMTDPFGPSTMLYTKEYYQAVKARLRNDDGMFVMHCESPISRPLAYQQILNTLGTVWKHQHVFYVYIQMYATLWSVVVNSDHDTVATIGEDIIRERLEARGVGPLQVFTPASHHAMQVPYPFISAIRAQAGQTPVVTDAASEFIDEIDLNSSDVRLEIREVHDGNDA